MTVRVDIITTFPEMFAPLQMSIIGKSVERGILQLGYVNPRDFTNDPHQKTDDTQYGGAEGMVMMVPPLLGALEKAIESGEGLLPRKVVLTSPQGRTFDQDLARQWTEVKHLIIVCGHYKGIDERFLDLVQPEEISIGDFVLTGGEIPAMALVDAVVRLLPNVVGGYGSVEDDSFYNGLLDCPRYTRPREVGGIGVPEVLLGGNHAKIEAWRKRMAVEVTRKKRPDLYEKWLASRAKENRLAG